MKWIGYMLLCLLIYLDASSLFANCRQHRRGRGKEGKETHGLSSLQILSSSQQNSSPQYSKCAVELPNKCSCSKHSGALSITCFHAGLETIPKLDVGPSLVKTLNFEQNQLSSLKIGSFFGIKIERLLLSNNSLSYLDFLAFWGLEFYLQTLDLSFNLFTSVPSPALHLLRNLRSLSLKGNKITSLDDFDFGYLKNLEVVALERNPIAVIAPNAFIGTRLSLLTLISINLHNGLESFSAVNLKHLRGLSLADNDLSDIPEGWFSNFKSLQYLNLDNNNFETIAAGTFDGIEDTLETLELNNNQFHSIPEEVINNLNSLKSLEMRHNRLHKIYPKTFNTSGGLQSIDLSHNSISKISVNCFEGLDNIQRIDLRHNSLITLDDRALYWEDPSGREILLGHNPWLCNCLLKWMKREYKRETLISEMFSDPMSIACDRPLFLEDVPVMRVHLKDFTCDHDYYYYSVVTEEDTDGEDDMNDDYDEYTEDYDDYTDHAGTT